MADSYKPWQRRGQRPNMAAPGGVSIPEPFDQPVLDGNGRMTPAWTSWLSQVKQQADRSRMQSIAGGTVQSVTYPLALSLGGTHADLSATGGSGHVVKQSGVGADFTVAALLAAEIPNLDTSKLTSGLLALARGGTHADLSATGGTRQVLQQASAGADITVASLDDIYAFNPQMRNWASVIPTPGNQAPTVVGMQALTVAGSMADGGLADKSSVQFSTSSNGVVLGFNPNVSTGAWMSKYDPKFVVKIKTGADITDVRYLIGFAFGASWNADNLGASHCGIRFSTSAGDANWVGVSRSDVGSQSVTSSLGAIAANTEYTLKLTISGDGTLATFQVDNNTAQTVSGAGLPTLNTNMNFNVHATNLAAEAKAFIFARAYLEWD